MDIRNRRALKQDAAAQLGQTSYPPRKLALIHAAVGVGVALVITLLDFCLSYQIESTGGLSGMGMRRILETVQMTLQYIQSLALPFWQIGFVFVALRIYRGEQAEPVSLLEGFRRFGPVLRLRLTEGVFFFGAAIACVYAASAIFMVTPFATPMLEKIMPMIDPNATVEEMEAVIAQIPIEELVQVSVPFLAIFSVLFLIVGGFLFYRFRLADFIVMDGTKVGGLRAMILSSRITRKNRLALLRLDLSFWWYYGLLALTAVVGYLDIILPQLGVDLPMSADVAWFVFYVLGLLVQVVVCWRSQSYVQTTYAAAYTVLQKQFLEQMAQQLAQQTPAPQNLPWDEYKTE